MEIFKIDLYAGGWSHTINEEGSLTIVSDEESLIPALTQAASGNISFTHFLIPVNEDPQYTVDIIRCILVCLSDYTTRNEIASMFHNFIVLVDQNEYDEEYAEEFYDTVMPWLEQLYGLARQVSC